MEESEENFKTLEDEIMINQGEYMVTKEVVEKDAELIEKLMLKRVEVFRDPKLDAAREYMLVLKEDLLPTKPEQHIGE